MSKTLSKSDSISKSRSNPNINYNKIYEKLQCEYIQNLQIEQKEILNYYMSDGYININDFLKFNKMTYPNKMIINTKYQSCTLKGIVKSNLKESYIKEWYEEDYDKKIEKFTKRNLKKIEKEIIYCILLNPSQVDYFINIYNLFIKQTKFTTTDTDHVLSNIINSSDKNTAIYKEHKKIYKNSINIIDNTILKSPKTEEDTYVYKGVIKDFQFFQKGYVSTSLKKKVAVHFAKNKKGYLLKIKIPKKSHVLYLYCKDKTEREILLPRNSYFKIDSKYKNKTYNIIQINCTLMTYLKPSSQRKRSSKKES